MPGADPVAVVGVGAVGTLLAKLFCTDTAMTVTTHAVQILGAVGYTTRYPAERYMREAKVLQIFEGSNQIQRLIISRKLNSDHTP